MVTSQGCIIRGGMPSCPISITPACKATSVHITIRTGILSMSSYAPAWWRQPVKEPSEPKGEKKKIIAYMLPQHPFEMSQLSEPRTDFLHTTKKRKNFFLKTLPRRFSNLPTYSLNHPFKTLHRNLSNQLINLESSKPWPTNSSSPRNPTSKMRSYIDRANNPHTNCFPTNPPS